MVFCTTFNPDTNRYNGPGQLINRSMYHKHNTIKALKQKSVENHSWAPSFRFVNTSTQIQTIEDKVDWLRTLPINPPTRLLVFQQRPSNTLIQNRKLDITSTANSLYFFVLNWHLFLSTVASCLPPQSGDCDALMGHIADELQVHEDVKVCDWHHQTGVITLVDGNDPENSVQAAVVNTGTYNASKQFYAHWLK